MKPSPIPLLLIFATARALAQGPLTPPGSPGPEMKSLQEIWDKIGGLETQVAQAQFDLTSVRAENQLLTTLLATSTVNLPWQISTLDSTNVVGSHCSLAFDTQGQPAISYYDVTQADLKFVRYDGTGWLPPVTVDASGDVGQFSSLAFSPDGHPSISYYDNTHGDLKLARYDGTTWVLGPAVDSTGDVGRLSSLAFGPDGEPAIVYDDTTNGNLKIARFTDTTPAFNTVRFNASHGSLAFAPNGQPSVACLALSGNEMLYIVYPGSGNWNSSGEVAALPAEATVSAPSLAYGPDGRPAISFRYDYDGHLKISRYTDAGFSEQPVNTGIDSVGGYNSLAFGPNGQPAIAYSNDSQGDLLFDSFNGSSWVRTSVDTAGTVGSYCSLAFGPDGQPAIAYLDATNGNLKFARKGIFKPAP